jgi:hypothetical protein
MLLEKVYRQVTFSSLTQNPWFWSIFEIEMRFLHLQYNLQLHYLSRIFWCMSLLRCTAPQLIILLEKASEFEQQWQQSIILKQIISRYIIDLCNWKHFIHQIFYLSQLGYWNRLSDTSFTSRDVSSRLSSLSYWSFIVVFWCSKLLKRSSI